MLLYSRQHILKGVVPLATCERGINMDYGSDKMKLVDPSGIWFERWSTKEQREELYELLGESFFNSTLSKRHLPDKEKRKKFLPAYFRYTFEKKLVSEKAYTGALKVFETINGKPVARTVYVGLYGFDTTPDPPSDPSEIMSIYKAGAERMIKRDEWVQHTIYTPLRAVAKDLGTECWILAHQATVGKYRGRGYATNHNNKFVEACRQYGLKNRKLENGQNFKIPPFHANIAADVFPGALRQFKKFGLETACHFHFNYRPGLRCYLEPGVKGDEDDVACHLLMVDERMAAAVRTKMQAYQSSL